MRRQKGFTLIELLIVVAIIGIIAAIAIPNLLNAINRGRQKRTMGDIRTLATAVEAYTVDFGFYPKIGDGNVSAQLVTYLVPTFLRKLPARDGWNNDLKWNGDGTSGLSYSFWSAAKNGPPSGATATVDAGGGAKTDFNADIVYSGGTFIQWPEGMQVN
jgi:type II secretion system protein G